MQLGFYFDQTRCIGCNTCVAACRDWNELNPGPVRYRNVTVTEMGSYPKANVYNLSLSCNHCKEPACIPACPAEAIYKRAKDGVVLIDRDKCAGIGDCITACPFSQPQRADDLQEPVQEGSWIDEHPAQKCTFCWDRLEVGQAPSCVAGCPARALDFGDMDELKKRYPSAVMATSKKVPGLPDDKGIGPSLLVKVKGKTPVIKKAVKDI